MNLRQETSALEQASSSNGIRRTPAPEPVFVPQAEAERPFFSLDLVRSLQLHRKLFLAFCLCGVLLAAVYVFRVWPIYISQSRVYVQPAPSSVMQNGAQRWPFDSNTYDSYIQQQVQNASNPAVLLTAMHKLNAGSWQRQGEPETEAAARLSGAVEVVRLGTSYEIGITARAHDPQLAAQIANAIAAGIVENSAFQQNAGDQQRLAILRDERSRVQNQLNADLAEQDTLSRQLGMASAGTTGGALLDGAIGTAHDELIKARTEHDQAAARFSALDASKGSSSTALRVETDEIVAADPGLNSMKTSLNQRRAILISQMSNLTPDNPAYKLDSAELAKINSSLDSMMDDLRSKAALRMQQKLRNDLERTAGVEARLNGQLRQLSATAASASPKLQRANDLTADIVRLRTRYAAVDDELNNLALKDSVSGAVHLSAAAVVPLNPAIFAIAKKAIPLALGGVLFGLLTVLIVNNLDKKIYIAADVERLLGAAPIATLPSFAEVSEQVFSEYLFRLSAAVERNVRKANLKSCVFTAAGTGAGTTTLASRAHEMLESMGCSTVLVDASSGASVPASETGAGKRVVLTDAAPLTASAESEYLARMADSVFVVIESGVTTRAELRAAASILERMNGPAAAFVLNRVKLAKADRSFRDSVKAAERHMRTQRPRHTRFAGNAVVAESEAEQEPMEIPQSSPEAALPQAETTVAALNQPTEESIAPPFAAKKPEPVPVPRVERSPEPPVQSRAEKNDFANALPERPEALPERPAVNEPVKEELASRTSRLSGLRGVLFERGLVHLNHADEPASESAVTARSAVRSHEAPPIPVRQRPVPIHADEPRAVESEEKPSRKAAAKTVVREVLAEPEFLPPREFVPLQGEAAAGEGEDPSHDRRNPFDNLEILPSWRGQYRRK